MSLRGAWRGWTGEVRGRVLQRLFLDPDTYHQFNNLILSTPRGTTEIDHVIVSQFGIFVVETKNRGGWIFGRESDQNWTQVHFRVKYTFPNPLRQNYGHVKALEELLGIGTEKMHSVVTFLGGCRFKSPMPPNVLAWDHIDYVKSKTAVLLCDEEVRQIVGVLQATKDAVGFLDRWRHASEVRERYASTDTCPKCRSPLVERIAREGARPGSTFLGCSAFPRCRYVKRR